jgi:putative proteasome-type protease
MTFCLGIKVDSGLVGIADTLVTAGSECTKAAKLFMVRTSASACSS